MRFSKGSEMSCFRLRRWNLIVPVACCFAIRLAAAIVASLGYRLFGSRSRRWRLSGGGRVVVVRRCRLQLRRGRRRIRSRSRRRRSPKGGRSLRGA